MSGTFFSWAEYWRKKRKQEQPQVRPLYSPTASLNQKAAQQPDQPHLNLVSDPMADWGAALEQFHNFQVSSGAEILGNGQHLETAADFQNVLAVQQANEMSGGDALAHPAPQPQTAEFQRQQHFDPWNNPLATVPSFQGFGPMKPPGM